ncbi:LamG domain-containing protein [Amycolatopsis thermoflava]|uniref:LamG domain-containing protein n=1 Tax=Amycolatopsis thermoflava TaxID=84480 RepID=UPI00040DC53B|nr:LamG domain-containing protein [Amycolatopsis thermoflava]
MALLAAWSFDESGLTVVDYSGNGRSFTLNDYVQRVEDGHTNLGLQSNGGGAVPLPDFGETASRSVMFWVREPVGFSSEHFIITWDVPSVGSAWGIDLVNGTPPKLRLYGRNASTVAYAEVDYPDDGEFHHVAGTYDQNFLRLYLDGVLAGTTALTGPLRTDSDPPKLFTGFTTATIDCGRVYDTALDITSVRAAKDTPVEGNLTAAAALAVTTSFINRCTAAAQRYAATLATQLIGSGSQNGNDKLKLILAQQVALNPNAYGERFAWLIASDGSITGDPLDEVIALKVSTLWDFVAGVTI